MASMLLLKIRLLLSHSEQEDGTVEYRHGNSNGQWLTLGDSDVEFGTWADIAGKHKAELSGLVHAFCFCPQGDTGSVSN